MKRIILFTLVSILAVSIHAKELIFPGKLSTTVQIVDMTYISGEPVNNQIEIEEGSSARIQFGINLNNPNGQSGNLKVYIKICSTCPDIQKTTEFVPSGFTSYSSSADITLFASEFDPTGGSLFARFETNTGIHTNSASVPVVVIEDTSGGTGPGGPGPTPTTCESTSTGPITNNTISYFNEDTTILMGSSTANINGTCPQGGSGSGDYTYKWEHYTSSTNTWQHINYGSGKNHSPGTLVTTTHYRRKVTSGSYVSYSNEVVLTVFDPNGVNIAPLAAPNLTACTTNTECLRSQYTNDLVTDHPYGEVDIANNSSVEFTWGTPARLTALAAYWKEQKIPYNYHFEYFNDQTSSWQGLDQTNALSGIYHKTPEFDIITSKVRLRVAQTSPIRQASIVEFYAYGALDTDNKAPLATASDHFNNPYAIYPAENANDGDPGTTVEFHKMWSGHYIGTNDVWYQLEWDQAITASQVLLISPDPYINKDYHIQYWNGGSWITVADIVGNTDQFATHEFSSITTSKLRVVFTDGTTHSNWNGYPPYPNGTNVAYLSEIEVY